MFVNPAEAGALVDNPQPMNPELAGTGVGVGGGGGIGVAVGGTGVGVAVTAGGTGITVDMDRAVASTLGAGSEAHATPKESTHARRSSGRSFI